jgi:starvation-inducible outer membrane lipoprotein
MWKIWITGILALSLSACSGVLTTEQDDSPTTTPAVKSVTSTPETVVPMTMEKTGRIIHLLDKAGCDFAGLHVTDSQVRKNSGSVTITCK